MFFVIIYSVIDQGYIGLSSASCHKDDIWDLGAELGLIWDHFRAKFKFGTSFKALFLLFGFFIFRDQIFRNRDFFPRPIFFETETETFFPKPNFLIPKPKPSKNWQKFRNREVSKPKCQSLLYTFSRLNSDYIFSRKFMCIV